jgi:hypothetical protein
MTASNGATAGDGGGKLASAYRLRWPRSTRMGSASVAVVVEVVAGGSAASLDFCGTGELAVLGWRPPRITAIGGRSGVAGLACGVSAGGGSAASFFGAGAGGTAAAGGGEVRRSCSVVFGTAGGAGGVATAGFWIAGAAMIGDGGGGEAIGAAGGGVAATGFSACGASCCGLAAMLVGGAV